MPIKLRIDDNFCPNINNINILIVLPDLQLIESILTQENLEIKHLI